MHKQNRTNGLALYGRRATHTGFTIVELLIVIVVIAILAAVSIVAFTGMQDRAIASAVRSDLSNFAEKIEIAKIDGDGLYPQTPTSAMGISASKNMYKTTHTSTGASRNNWYYCTSPDRAAYALAVVDIKDNGFMQSSVNGLAAKNNGNNNIQDATSACNEVGSPSSSSRTGMASGNWSSWVH